MAQSSCPKCGGHEFEVSEHTPADETFKLMFVQCATCGTVIGVQDYYGIEAVVEEQNRVLKELADRLKG